MSIHNITNLEIDGVDRADYPDFCDAFFSYAEYADTGVALTDAELDALTTNHPEVVNAMAHESLH